MTGSFRSCASMLLMTLRADQSSFQTCGDTFHGIPLFPGGDFNCIESLELDKAGGDALAGDKGSVELKDFAYL